MISRMYSVSTKDTEKFFMRSYLMKTYDSWMAKFLKDFMLHASDSNAHNEDSQLQMARWLRSLSITISAHCQLTIRSVCGVIMKNSLIEEDMLRNHIHEVTVNQALFEVDATFCENQTSSEAWPSFSSGNPQKPMNQKNVHQALSLSNFNTEPVHCSQLYFNR